MALMILQILLLFPAGVVVFVMWRRIAASSPTVAWLVTVGVLVRAVAGQIAFWISYLRLPIARSLQLGDGFWIFGLDAQTFFQQAVAAAHSGPLGILFLDRTTSSVSYVQTLGTAVLLFGAVASAGLLLNVVAYLGCCLILLSFGDPTRYRVVVFAIAILSLAPSPVIWALQPMKDMWFLLLMASFFGAARAWQDSWNGKQLSARGVWSSLIMILMVYAMSGIRWYVGFIAAVAFVPFVLLAAWRAPRRLAAACTAVVIVPALFGAVVAGSKPYVAPILYKVVHAPGIRMLALPHALLDYLNESRDGFDRSGGTTLIGAGHAITAIDARAGKTPVAVSTATPSLPSPASASTTANTSTAVSPSTAVSSSTGVSASTATRTSTTASTSPAGLRPNPSTVSSSEIPTVLIPTSPLGRLAAGVAVLTLPRTLAQRLGLVAVRVGRGGRSLWIFVDADTIAFDVAGILCIWSIVSAVRRRPLPPPLFWLVLSVTVVLGGALAYTISNFGTLFRQRDMVLLCLAMVPLTTLSPSPVNAFVQEKIPSRARDVGDVVPSV
jgi:hypothetical protein